MERCANEDIVRFLMESEAIGESDEIAFDMPLKQLGVDSLDKFNLFLLVEEKFSVTVPDEDFAALDTIQAITDYINRAVA